jgi:glycosyltransferase involved in cell wall biosynthesis
MNFCEDLRDDYCHNLPSNEYCIRIKNFPTKMFCEIACMNHPTGWDSGPIEEIREKRKVPLTAEQRNDPRMVSILIPVWDRDEKYLEKTIQSVKDTAIGPFEILVMHDEGDQGHRHLTNEMARQANGEFLLRLDCHCKLYPEWDARMKSSCREDTLVVPILDALDEIRWEGRHKDMGFVCLNRHMENVYPLKWRPVFNRDIEEETISIIGCCYMCRKEDYWKRKGCDESLGKWGFAGPEISLKFWLTNGKVVVRTDVVVCHLFRGGPNPFGIKKDNYAEIGKKLFEKLINGREYGLTRSLEWLMNRFPEYFKAGAWTESSNFRPIPVA